MVNINYEDIICKRAHVQDVVLENHNWYAIVCSHFGQEKHCVRIDITSKVEPIIREEAERILREECMGDEECMERYWDTAFEEAEEKLAESKIPEIVATDFVNEIIEMACPDLLDAMAPRKGK